jgi:CheY-like chemotaxis protein
MALQSVLLVDDDSTSNFLHKRIMQRLELQVFIDVSENGKEALSLIANESALSGNRLVLLDINMPVMDGWEFLDEFEKLPAEVKDHCKIFVLSTSINPDDKLRAESKNSVCGYLTKPLTKEILLDILDEWFVA